MNQSNSSKQVLLSVIGVAILVVAVVGVSFAFFNYTRTGEANTVRTGTIYFNSTNSLINVSNLFPVAKNDARIDAAGAGNSQNQDVVGVAVVTIEGYTTYKGGVDYVVTAENVNFNTTGSLGYALPISVRVTQSGLATAGNTTTTYATDALSSGALNDLTQIGDANVNKIYLYNYELKDNAAPSTFVDLGPTTKVLAKGHIADVAGVRATSSTASYGDTPTTGRTYGTITIRAYIDRNMVAITDTRATGTAGTTPGNVASEGLTNGTGEDWVNNRRVFTTEQWNSLNDSDASFRIKVVAGETVVTDTNGTGSTTATIGA